MRSIKLVALTALALVAFGAIGTAMASAADVNTPSVLCLGGKPCSELTGTFEGGGSELTNLKGKKNVVAENTKFVLKNCEAAPEGVNDTRLCKDNVIDFTGTTFGGAKCNTEGDEPGVVLVLLDVHMADELSTGSVLEPLMLFHILNNKLELLEITLKCAGGGTVLVKGTIGCLPLVGAASAGLKTIATTEEVTVACAFNAETKDPVTGKCEILCELLEKNPFLANLGGGFEDSWMKISAKGKLNQSIFIDD